MNSVLKLIKDKMVLKGQELEYNSKTAVSVGRFRAQKILGPDKIEKLIQHPCHGGSFITLKSNEGSNSIMTDTSTRGTDAFLHFMKVGRADYLPTPDNIQK
jgi:ureidoglycolate hydrolase